jgi:Ca2+-binding RTX toxin-like protein
MPAPTGAAQRTVWCAWVENRSPRTGVLVADRADNEVGTVASESEQTMNLHLSQIPRTFGLGLTGAAALAAFGTVAATPVAAKAPLTAAVAGDTLNITASPHADRVALRLAPGTPLTLQVDFGDDGITDLEFDRSTFTAIDVLLGNGDDQFRVDRTNGAFVDEDITVDGGNGADRLDGGDGDEVFLGGNGDDVVDGNRGIDTAVLGNGNDTFRWDPGDGSDVVDGSRGFDSMLFFGSNVAEEFGLFAEGQRTVLLRNVGAIRMDMDGIERTDLRALGGADLVTIGDLAQTDMRLADLDLAASTGVGDGANDSVIVNGTPGDDQIHTVVADGKVEVDGLPSTTRIAGAESTDSLRIDALAGNDDVVVDDAVTSLIAVIVNLGTGQF